MLIASLLVALAPLAVLVVVVIRERGMVRRWNDRLAETDKAVTKALETVGQMAAATVQLIEAGTPQAPASTIGEGYPA